MTEDSVTNNSMTANNKKAFDPEEFFKKFAGVFNDSEKKGLFLLGYLTGQLAKIQYNSLGSTPIESKLFGLKLNKKNIKRIYTDIMKKLAEYDAMYSNKTLIETIAKYFVDMNKDFTLSEDEMSYYFALGYAFRFNFNK